MTDLQEKAMRMALEALNIQTPLDKREFELRNSAIEALRQALAQPNDFIYSQNHAFRISPSTGDFGIGSAPAKREWVGLTDEEMKKTWYEMQNIMGWYSFQEISQAVEAKLKEKNGA